MPFAVKESKRTVRKDTTPHEMADATPAPGTLAAVLDIGR
jgi:hypothetical protein